jgi:glutathione synthase/RimK-type ligase-like ATP-grasp enzyme
MIVLWGPIGDGPLASVYECLRQTEIATTLIEQSKVGECRFRSNACGGTFNGRVTWQKAAIELSDAKAIYLRQYDFTKFPNFRNLGPSSKKWQSAAKFEDGMLLWSELSDAVVINRPSAMSSNNSKPYQLKLISTSGFRVPATLVTTDPDEVMAFLNVYGQVIYKSVSSRRSIIARLGSEDLARIDSVASCPTQFQEYIPGRDFRIHVLGKRTFVHEIKSDAVDYRYSADSLKVPAVLPPEVDDLCVALTQALGLVFSGIDLRLTPDGEWYCFEVNPSPGYTYFEQGSGEITRALADFLTVGER